MLSTPVISMPAAPAIRASVAGSSAVSASVNANAKIAMARRNLCGRCSPFG